jgi:hypothetical protein
MMFDFEVGDSFAQPDFLLYGGGPKKKRQAKSKPSQQRSTFRKLENAPTGLNPADQLLYDESLREQERSAEGERLKPRKKLAREVIPPQADTLVNPTTHHTEDDLGDFDLEVDDELNAELLADLERDQPPATEEQFLEARKNLTTLTKPKSDYKKLTDIPERDLYTANFQREFETSSAMKKAIADIIPKNQREADWYKNQLKHRQDLEAFARRGKVYPAINDLQIWNSDGKPLSEDEKTEAMDEVQRSLESEKQKRKANRAEKRAAQRQALQQQSETPGFTHDVSNEDASLLTTDQTEIEMEKERSDQTEIEDEPTNQDIEIEETPKPTNEDAKIDETEEPQKSKAKQTQEPMDEEERLPDLPPSDDETEDIEIDEDENEAPTGPKASNDPGPHIREEMDVTDVDDQEARKLQQQADEIERGRQAFINSQYTNPNFAHIKEIEDGVVEMEKEGLLSKDDLNPDGSPKKEVLPLVIEYVGKKYKQQYAELKKALRLRKRLLAKDKETKSKPRGNPGWHMLEGDTRIWQNPQAIDAYPQDSATFSSKFGPTQAVFGIEQ